MNSQYLRLILFLSLFNLNCASEEFCNEILSVFQIENTTPILNFQEGETRDDILSKFENNFGEEICYKDFAFGWKTNEGLILSHFILNCPLKTSLLPRQPEVRIKVNQKRKAIINGENIIELNSLKDWICNEFIPTTEEEFYKKEFAILWDFDSSKSSLDFAAIEIVKGLSFKLSEISRKKFEKPFCKLNPTQKSEVRNEFPYRLIFDIGIPAPPPPPPIQH